MNANQPDPASSKAARIFCRTPDAAAAPVTAFARQNDFRGPQPRNRLFDYIWLIYSAFFVLAAIQHNTAKGWIRFGIAYAVFFAIYSGLVFARTRRQQYWLFATMAIMGFLYIPIDPSFLGIFIYIAAFLPFAVESVVVCFVCILGCSLSVLTEGLVLHLSPWSWGIVGFFSLAVGVGNIVAAQHRRSAERLIRAHQEMAQLAKVAERERIARDLHDLLGHTLSVVVLKSELAGRLFDNDPARARIEIGEVETISRQALQEVREAVTGYRMQGLQAEIDSAQKSLAAAGVKLICVNKPPKLGPAEESVLALILREAVTNVLRHARATECWLDFTSGPAGADLVVTDNGRGGIREEGNGLRGMRERVQMLGGSFRLESGQGTKLFIHLPGNA